MPKYSIMFARFPGGRSEDPDCGDWLVQSVLHAKQHPAIGSVLHWFRSDTPITMVRNEAIEVARKNHVDILVMLDSDMKVDAYWQGNKNRIGTDPNAKPFFATALDFMLAHQGPCCVAAPYCGQPPHENIFIFRWVNTQSDHPNVDMKLEQFSREDAAARGGFEEVAALPTGLYMIDMRAIQKIKPPYFDYEWEDEPFRTKKASTEDVYFTRNLSLAGVPQYVLWDSWCAHWKRKAVGKPTLVSVDMVREDLRTAILRNQPQGERLMMIGEGQPKNGQMVAELKRVAAEAGWRKTSAATVATLQANTAGRVSLDGVWGATEQAAT